MDAFVTGSHAYGSPRPDSDVDLVVFVSPTDAEVIRAESDTKAIPIRYGNLNLIITTDQQEYFAWQKFTDDMKAKRDELGIPISPEEARQEFLPRRIRCGSGTSVNTTTNQPGEGI